MSATSTYNYMAVSNAAAIGTNWQSYKGYTVRPLPSTERYYQSVVDRYGDRHTPSMLYGGTPEIRDCLHRARQRVIIIDRSELMVRAMGLLTIGARPLLDNEDYIEGNWLDLPLPDESAGLVLGDDAVNMVKWEAFPRFMAEAHRILRRGGLFACHLLVQPEERLRKQPVADVIRGYEAGDIRSHFDFASRVNFCFYDDRSYEMGWQQSIAGLRRLLDAGEIGGDCGFTERFALCNSVFACPPRQAWEALIEPMFATVEVFYPTEHDYCRFEPLYLLRKR